MRNRNVFFIAGTIIFLIVSIALIFVSSTGTNIYLITADYSDFGRIFWQFRQIDVLVQIMLIFTSALGILVFFADKDKK